MKRFKKFFEESKPTSAGMILTDGKRVLGAQPFSITGGRRPLDIPKGLIDIGESAIKACIREVREETGLHIHPNELEDLGLFTNYSKHKNIHAFLKRVDKLPALSSLRCNSQWEDEDGEWYPEIHSFHYVQKKNIFKHFHKGIARIIKTIEL